MSLGERITAQIRSNGNGSHQLMPAGEPNPLQKAFDDYKDMERDRNEARHECSELRIHNQALMAENGMLREALERCETDRIRLQSVSSTLMGRLLAINSVISDAVKASIKHGVEAVEAMRPEEKTELDQAGAEAQEIFERVTPPTVTM